MTSAGNIDSGLTSAAAAAAAVAAAIAGGATGNEVRVIFAHLVHAVADKNNNGKLSKNEWRAAGLDQSVGRFKEVKGHKDGVTFNEFLQASKNAPKDGPTLGEFLQANNPDTPK